MATCVQSFFSESNCRFRVGQKSTLYHLEKLTSGRGLDKPIVMAPIPGAGKFKILDGNHRMAAAWLCKLKGMSIAFDAWVAEPEGLKSTNGGVC